MLSIAEHNSCEFIKLWELCFKDVGGWLFSANRL